MKKREVVKGRGKEVGLKTSHERHEREREKKAKGEERRDTTGLDGMRRASGKQPQVTVRGSSWDLMRRSWR